MSCDINIDNYIFSIEKVSRLGLKYTIHYVFVGTVEPEYEAIFKKFENRSEIQSSDVTLLKKKYKNYYLDWVKVVKEKKTIKFINATIRIDDSINEIKKKIYVYLSNPSAKPPKYILTENQELWLKPNKDEYFMLGSYYENYETEERVKVLPSVYQKFELDNQFLNINSPDNKLKLKTNMNSYLIIDILNDLDIKTLNPVIYLCDAIEEKDILKDQKINIDLAVIKGYFKKYWPIVELNPDDKSGEYLVNKDNYSKENYITSLINNLKPNTEIFKQCDIITMNLTINQGLDEEIDLYNIFDYLREKKIDEQTPFIKYDDNSFKSSFTIISKAAIDNGKIKKTDLIKWLGVKKEEHKKVNGISMKRCFTKFNDINHYSSILIDKKGVVNLHISFKQDNRAKISDIRDAIVDCKSILSDINNNTTSIKLKEMSPIGTPNINISDSTVKFKSNTKMIFMNVIIPYKYDSSKINLDKLYDFAKNFPNFLSKLPKENLVSVNDSDKDGLSIKLKYNRVSGFANMNQIMTRIDILKQDNKSDAVIIKTIEKLYQKSFEEARSYLLEWKKKFSSLKSAKIDPQFKSGILVTITKSTIKLDGITKIYQVPLIYKFFTTFMTLFFMREELEKTDKEFRKYFMSNNRKTITFSTTKNIENIPFEKLDIDLNINDKYNEYEIDDDIYLEEDIKKIQEDINDEYNMANNYSKLSSINKHYRNIGLASNDEIEPALKLTCEDVVIEVDTCEDLCNDSKYFLRRLQRYDNRLFKYNLGEKKSEKKRQYSRVCQRTSQPVILPYNPEEEPKIDRRSFSYTIKYSTDPEKPRWYICPKFWCPYCEIPIFEGDVDPKTIRQRKTEGDGSKCNIAKCPRGDHQILYRDANEGNYYPSFDTRGYHPEGYCLPCCFKIPHNDPKYPSKYQKFQKCLGVNVNDVVIDTSKIYINKNLGVLTVGKYGLLPYAISLLLGTKLSSGYLGNNRGYLRRGIKQNDNNSFLACVADIMSCDKTNGFWTYEKVKKVIIDKLDEKLFRSLDAGNLYVLFDDKTKNITPMENFINYLNHTDLLMKPAYLWDLLQRPGILFENGANIVIFEDESILCPYGEHLRHFYDNSKHTILMIKQSNNQYEPIYYLEGNGKTATHTCIFPPSNETVDNIVSMCKKECENSYDINWELVLKDNVNKFNLHLDNMVTNLGPYLQIVLNEILTSIQNKKLKADYTPVMQYLDSYNKVFAIQLKNGLFLPIRPSKLIVELPYKEIFNYNELKLLDFTTTVKYLNELADKTSLKCQVNHKILDLKDGNKIVAVVTELNKIVPVKITPDTDNKLKISNFSYYSDADEALQQKIVIIDNRIEQINKKNFEDETYQRMRFELSKFLKIPNNKEYFDEVLAIINEENKDINETRKKMYKVLNEIFMKLISFNDNEIDYQFYKTPNTRTPCFMRTVIKNGKKKSSENINLFSCSDDPHCTIEKNECKLYLNKLNLLNNERKINNYEFYMAMIIDELVRYRLKRYEILNDKIAYIIDKEKVILNPKKYVIIYNMSSEDIEKLIDMIYEDNKGINIDKRKLYEQTTTKSYSFPRDKYVMGISKFTYSIEKLSGRWEQLLGNKYIVQKNMNSSIYLSLSYSLSGLNINVENQNSKTIINIIKRKVCDFIEKHDTDMSMVLKFMNIISLKKNNSSLKKSENSIKEKLKKVNLSNKALTNKLNISNQNNKKEISTLLELYQKELFKQRNEYRLISSTEKLVREIMNDTYTGCIIDIIIVSIIYNVNIIVLNKRHYKETIHNFMNIGPQFGLFNDNILLYKSSNESDIKSYIYNIIRYGNNKYLFKQNDLPSKFINYIKTI